MVVGYTFTFEIFQAPVRSQGMFIVSSSSGLVFAWYLTSPTFSRKHHSPLPFLWSVVWLSSLLFSGWCCPRLKALLLENRLMIFREGGNRAQKKRSQIYTGTIVLGNNKSDDFFFILNRKFMSKRNLKSFIHCPDWDCP